MNRNLELVSKFDGISEETVEELSETAAMIAYYMDMDIEEVENRLIYIMVIEEPVDFTSFEELKNLIRSTKPHLLTSKLLMAYNLHEEKKRGETE